VQKTDAVLEIGTGSGFMAALLSHRAKQVLSLEINGELAALARSNLQQAGVTNVQVRQADGAAGAPADGPFDVILLSGSVAQVPQALLDQLRVGGRLAAIVGDDPIMCAHIVTRVSANEFSTITPWDANAPRLQNFAEHSQFSF
jgi:protein-L-isoaspartate(D-aspartate) O-methyltransferase